MNYLNKKIILIFCILKRKPELEDFFLLYLLKGSYLNVTKNINKYKSNRKGKMRIQIGPEIIY